jgi:CRP-like cAMP-binding protein
MGAQSHIALLDSAFKANRVLGALSDDAVAQLAPHMMKRGFDKGTPLWSEAQPSGAITFPLSGLVSITWGDPLGGGVEVGFAGNDSAVGFSTDDVTRGTIHVPGTFLQVRADRFWTLAAELAELRLMAECCREAMLTQARALAACNALHDVQARLCRWLLQVSDRAGVEITSTQEEIAQLLGVRRTTLTLIAHRLQQDQVIRYRRGLIVVRDRARLRELACGCYREMAEQRPPAERMVPTVTRLWSLPKSDRDARPPLGSR